MPDEADRQAAQEQLERRRLARLIDVLPVFSGFASPDGHIIQSHPNMPEAFLWALPAFAYSQDSITQIADLCERAANGERVQVERSYLKSDNGTHQLLGRGLLTITPVMDEKDRIDELGISLIDCDENGLTPPDARAKTRLAVANERIDTMLSLAQTVIEASNAKTAMHDQQHRRDRMTERLNALASAIDIIAAPDRTTYPFKDLVRHVIASAAGSDEAERIRLDINDGEIPMTHVPLTVLLLTELISNARHWGALRTDIADRHGHVLIQTDILDEASLRTFHLHWIEDGGPKVSGLLTPGFGFAIAEHLFPQTTGGRSRLLNSEDGLSWSFEMPVPEGSRSFYSEIDFS